jgi:hypothetical protein
MARRALHKLLLAVVCWGIILFSLRCLQFFDSDKGHHTSKVQPGRLGQASVLSKSPSASLEPAQYRTQSLESILTDAFDHEGSIPAGVTLIQPESLTAVMPLSAVSLVQLNETLAPLLFKTSCLQQLILVCPEDILEQARRATRQIIYSINSDMSYPELLIHSYHAQVYNENTPTLYALSGIMTDWTLILDEDGINSVNSLARQTLLNPQNIQLPVGPKCRGYCHSVTDVSRSFSSFNSHIHHTLGLHYTPVTGLAPPFVIPTALLKDQVDSLNGNINSWERLGLFVASYARNDIGGLLMSFPEDATPNQTQNTGSFGIKSKAVNNDETSQPGLKGVDTAAHKHHFSSSRKSEKNARSGLVAIIFPTYNDLSVFSRAACRLKKDDNLLLRVLLYAHTASLASDYEQSERKHGNCLLNYDTITPEDDVQQTRSDYLSTLVQQWLETLEQLPNVIITTDAIKISHMITSPLIVLPSEDLISCEWIGSLSISELASELSWLSSPTNLLKKIMNRRLAFPTFHDQHHYERSPAFVE